jgi:thioredoxin reductase (NADPH)
MKISLGRYKKAYDIAVIGGGAAGISAAINGKAARKNVVVFESGQPLGKIRKAREIRNYPGFPLTTGEELSEAFLSHLRDMGVELRREKVTGIVREGDFVIYTPRGRVRARTVILAVGLRSEEVIPGEDELLGKGVSYCVVCDGAAYSGGKVAVISDSEEGEREAEALRADFGCEVTYMPLYDMGSSGKPYRVVRDKPLSLVSRAGGVEVELENGSLLVDGVFLIKRFTSPSRMLDGLEMRGRHIAVDRDMQTSVPGVFAAGDCTGGPFKIAKAVGEGQVAALSAIRYLSQRGSEEMEVMQ